MGGSKGGWKICEKKVQKLETLKVIEMLYNEWITVSEKKKEPTPLGLWALFQRPKEMGGENGKRCVERVKKTKKKWREWKNSLQKDRKKNRAKRKKEKKKTVFVHLL